MLPSTTKEQRGPMYEDLVPLVVPGFLTAKMQIGGMTLGLRSLSSNDLSYLRRIALEGGTEWPFHIAAASVWMMDGLPLLESYPYSQKYALQALRSTHKSVVRAVFAQALSFFLRMKKANRYFEAFLYEDESRRLWKATNNGAHQIWTQPGLPGLDRLGLNSFQASWVQWNKSEDDRLDDDYAWSLTKVLVSVQSSKSAKKLDSKDKTRLESEKTRRTSVQDRAYHLYTGELDEEGNAAHPAFRVLQPRSAPELAEEMRRWVAGEKDFHDTVISDYKDRVKAEIEARERAETEAIERAHARRALEEQILGIEKPSLVGWTKEELARMRPPAEKPGARFVVEAAPQLRTNRYIRDLPDPGALAVKDGRVVYRDPSTSSTEAAEPPTLDEQIASRKPRINGV